MKESYITLSVFLLELQRSAKQRYLDCVIPPLVVGAISLTHPRAQHFFRGTLHICRLPTTFQGCRKVSLQRSSAPKKPRRNITVLMKGTKWRTPCFRCETPPPQKATRMRKSTTSSVTGEGIKAKGKSKSTSRTTTKRSAIQKVYRHFQKSLNSFRQESHVAEN